MLNPSCAAKRPPFVDRSNSSRSNNPVSNKLLAPLPIRHKRSRQVMVGSSDLVQEVNDAIYNASLVHSSNTSSPPPEKENLGVPARTDIEPTAGHAHGGQQITSSGPRFINKPQGTPLGTILEQHSTYTLRSRCSNKTLTITSYRLPNSPDKVLVEFQPGISHVGRPVSDDEGVLGHLRRVRTIVDREVERLRKSTSSTDHAVLPLPTPAKPPFQAPKRPATPPGVPSFPTAKAARFATATQRTRARHREILVHAARRIRQAVTATSSHSVPGQHGPSPNARPWRPPVSGHATFRYEESGGHPFHSAPIAPAEASTTRASHENISVPAVSPEKQISLHRRSVSSTSTTSAAQRALGAIAGQAVPVNPARALSSGIARSVAVPKHVGSARLVTIAKSPTERSATTPYAADTVRTVDLIDQFPPPPSQPVSAVSVGQTGHVRFAAPVPMRPTRPALSVLKVQDAQTTNCIDAVQQGVSPTAATTSNEHAGFGAENALRASRPKTAVRIDSADIRTDSVLHQPLLLVDVATTGGIDPELTSSDQASSQAQSEAPMPTTEAPVSQNDAVEPNVQNQEAGEINSTKHATPKFRVRSYRGPPLIAGALALESPPDVAMTSAPAPTPTQASTRALYRARRPSQSTRPKSPHEADDLSHIVYNNPTITTYGQMCPHRQRQSLPASNPEPKSLVSKLRMQCRRLLPNRSAALATHEKKNECWRCRISDAIHAVAVKIDLCCEGVNMMGMDRAAMEAEEVRVVRPVVGKAKMRTRTRTRTSAGVKKGAEGVA